MRFFTARRLALAAAIPALFLFSVIPGCSQQGEGDRCGDSTYGVSDSSDCADGLTCTAASTLLNGVGDKGGRCCRSDGTATDSRCTRSVTTGTDSDAAVPDSAGAGGA